MFPAYHFDVTVSMAKEELLTSADAGPSSPIFSVFWHLKAKIILTIAKSVVSIFICAILNSPTNSSSQFPVEGRYS